jgi:hypothetical protein
MATLPGATNFINTTTGNGLTSSVDNILNAFPYLNQFINEDVKRCAVNNVLSDCGNPPSLTQIDQDINDLDKILEWLVLNDSFEKEIMLYYSEVSIKFLKAKKCIQAQYPCWGDENYRFLKDFINNFEFVAS